MSLGRNNRVPAAPPRYTPKPERLNSPEATVRDLHTTRSSRDLSALIEQWQRIRRGEEAFGEGQPAQQARTFYFEHLLESVCQRARAAWRDEDASCDLLISLAGFS